jgi:hypothetical protein
MKEESNINAGVVRDRLADHMRHGRNAAEAAGEERWLAEVQQRMGVLSQSSVDEIVAIAHDWIAAEMGEEHASLGRMAARMYADFLAQQVDVTEISAWPRGKVDRAWQQWRARAEGSKA